MNNGKLMGFLWDVLGDGNFSGMMHVVIFCSVAGLRKKTAHSPGVLFVPLSIRISRL